jgi:hypothetical protein
MTKSDQEAKGPRRTPLSDAMRVEAKLRFADHGGFTGLSDAG